MRDDFVIKSTSGKTNRSTIHADSRNPTDSVQIQKLIINLVQNGIDDLTKFIDPLVKQFDNTLQGSIKKVYRGVDISVEKHLLSKQIGPAPNANDGRYNVQGEKCIYLIDNIDFLYSELNSASILVQQFDLPINKLKIADLSTNNDKIHNSLSLVFDMAENGMTSSGYAFESELEKIGKSRYLVSQKLSFLFKKYGWDGIYIPGVHGEQGRHYHNLTIFGSIVDNWKAWAVDSYFPKKRT